MFILQFKKLLDTGNTRISLVYIKESYDPHKSFSTYTNIKINYILVKAIVDSGAEVTIIALSVVKRLKLVVTKTENQTRYVAANNEVLTHTGFYNHRYNNRTMENKTKSYCSRKIVNRITFRNRLVKTTRCNN